MRTRRKKIVAEAFKRRLRRVLRQQWIAAFAAVSDPVLRRLGGWLIDQEIRELDGEVISRNEVRGRPRGKRPKTASAKP